MKILIISINLMVILILSCTSTGTKQNISPKKEITMNTKEQKHWDWLENRENWKIYPRPGYQISFDSENVKNGEMSGVIEQTTDLIDWQTIWVPLPHNYEGEQITLSGYIKTENVSDGYAGLFMRIDPNIAFDNMEHSGVTGTTDWTRYEITLNMMPSKTTGIVIGGLLMGKGKMWLNDLRVSIDGKDLSEATILEPKKYSADDDKEFDEGSNVALLEDYFSQQRDAVATIENLELLGRIWGFLKYHHPEIAKGNYNWDYELFRMLPEYLELTANSSVNLRTRDVSFLNMTRDVSFLNMTRDDSLFNMLTNDRDQFLLDWINKLGEINKETPAPETKPDAYLKPDLSWVENSDLNDELKNKLREIYSYRNQEDHYYISMRPYVENPVFTNERDYRNMPYPDAGFRLLTLYRYWNMINYFFPYKYITDKDWNDVLIEYIPELLKAKDRYEYEKIVIKLITEVHDTHAYVGNRFEIEKRRGNYFPPFRVWFVENKLVVMDYFNPEFKETSGLEIGDIITHINGEAIESIVERLKTEYPASNQAARLTFISRDIMRSTENTLEIDYISKDTQQKKQLQLYERDQIKFYNRIFWNVSESDVSYKFLEDDIGYVNVACINLDDIPKIMNAFKETKGIIIDIRNYPAVPTLNWHLSCYFIKEPTAYAKFSKGNMNNPGEFNFVEPYEMENNGEPYKGKLIVIINEISISNAEFISMAFRAGINTTIIGSTTAGADGDVSGITLPGALYSGISGIGVYYPDGTPTQRIGIVPDVWIEPTVEGIRLGRDEVLEKGIEIIMGN